RGRWERRASRSRAVVSVDLDVAFGQVAGPDGGRGAPRADMDGDVDLIVLHIGAHDRLVVVRRRGAVDGGDVGTEADGQTVAVDGLLGLASRHDDAAPVGVLAGDGGLDQGAVGDRLGQFAR